jgi:hypothetical protein
MCLRFRMTEAMKSSRLVYDSTSFEGAVALTAGSNQELAMAKVSWLKSDMYRPPRYTFFLVSWRVSSRKVKGLAKLTRNQTPRGKCTSL